MPTTLYQFMIYLMENKDAADFLYIFLLSTLRLFHILNWIQ
jgi:hypothetical protein